MKPEFRLTIFALLSVLIVWVLYLLVVPYVFKWDWDESGRFGDTFGSERSVYGSRVCGSSFATLIQQSRKIDETKRDVEGERQLQKRTTELVAEQAKALALVARLNALTSRIEAYQVQIDESNDSGNTELTQRLVGERRQLLLKLDEVLRSDGN